MKSLLFSPDLAETLNNKISNQLAPHLFMFCNYQPDNIKVFSYDAQFLLGVLNLYKLVIDASIVKFIGNIAEVAQINFDKKSLNEYLNQIQLLRAIIGHNISEQNGMGNQLIEYKLWLNHVTGKSEITAASDYEMAFKELGIISENLYKVLDDFVSRVSKVVNKKSEIISSWEDQIFSFYKRDSNQIIYLKQMNEAYLSRCNPSRIQRKQLSDKVANWIRSYYRQEVEDKIEEQKALFDKFAPKLKGADLNKLEKNINHKINEYSDFLLKIEEKVLIATRCDDIKKLSAYHYQKFFLSELDFKLRKALVQIKINKNSTMLPQDLMQAVIELCFDNIRTEDF